MTARWRGQVPGVFTGSFLFVEGNSAAVMRLATASAFVTFLDHSALKVTWLEEAGLVYLLLIAAARSWPRVSAAGTSLVGAAVVGIGVVLSPLVILGGADRTTFLRLILILLLHGAMVASATWRFAARAKHAG